MFLHEIKVDFIDLLFLLLDENLELLLVLEIELVVGGTVHAGGVGAAVVVQGGFSEFGEQDEQGVGSLGSVFYEEPLDFFHVLLTGLVATLDALVLDHETEHSFQFELDPVLDSADEALEETGEFFVGEGISSDGP